MRHLPAVLTAIVTAFCFVSTRADAAPITFGIRGIVFVVGPAQSGVVEFHDPFTGSFTFDSALQDSQPESNWMGVYGPLSDFSFSAGSYTGGLATHSTSEIVVENIDDEFFRHDHFTLVVVSAMGASLGAFQLQSVTLRLADLDGDALHSDALPFVLAEGLQEGSVELHFTDEAGNFSDVLALVEVGVIPATEPAPVPEPATLTLLGLGLAGMGARRWRQRKAS